MSLGIRETVNMLEQSRDFQAEQRQSLSPRVAAHHQAPFTIQKQASRYVATSIPSKRPVLLRGCASRTKVLNKVDGRNWPRASSLVQLQASTERPMEEARDRMQECNKHLIEGTM